MDGKIKNRVATNRSRVGWLILALVLALTLILVWADGSALAQGPEGEGVTAAATVDLKISYQGKLTDASGSPVSGATSVKFTLYDSTGAALWTETKTITPDSEGLFTTQLGDTTAIPDMLFDGRALWLGVKVGSDAEMTPRQEVLPAPYAAGLRPGAVISDTSFSAVLIVSNYGSGVGVYGQSGNPPITVTVDPVGVWGDSESGIGVYGSSSSDIGVEGLSSSSHGVHGQSGTASGKTPLRAGVWGDSQSGIGVVGISVNQSGVYGDSTGSYGVWGLSSSGTGVSGTSVTGVGGSFSSNSGDIIEAYDSTQRRFYVSNTGDVYADGAYNCPTAGAEPGACVIQGTGADFAEMKLARGDPEPGDVLVIDADGQLLPSTSPYAASVVGVYSTQPGYLGGGDKLGQEGYAPLAIVGIVPVKASAENGPIVPGDMLTTSSTPGHAMRAGDDPPQGTVVGKALGSLEEGTGVIELLVMLQ